MELFILDLNSFFLLVRELIIIKIFNGFGVNIAIVDILLQFGFVLLSFLDSHHILTLDVEWVLAV